MEGYIDEVKPKVVKTAVWGIIITIIILMLTYFESLLKPIFIATFLWYIIKEIKYGLGKIKIRGVGLPKFVINALALLVVILLNILIFEILSANIRSISQNIPEYQVKMDEILNQINFSISNRGVGGPIEEKLKEIDYTAFAGSVANFLTSIVGSSIIVLIYLAFLMLEESVFPHKLERLFPNKDKKFQKLQHAIQRINHSVKQYIVLPND